MGGRTGYDNDVKGREMSWQATDQDGSLRVVARRLC